MELKEVLESLCYHDRRNPDCIDEEDDTRKADCACDNCFYGRTKLAEYILTLLNQNNKS